jgi:hypothetical protein
LGKVPGIHWKNQQLLVVFCELPVAARSRLEQPVLQGLFLLRQLRKDVVLHQKLRIIVEVMGVRLLLQSFALIARKTDILQVLRQRFGDGEVKGGVVAVEVDERYLGEISLWHLFKDRARFLFNVVVTAVQRGTARALPPPVVHQLRANDHVDGHQHGMHQIGKVPHVWPPIDHSGTLG